MWDLPSHLASLNSLTSPAPHHAAVSQEQEEAFWEFMHTDELFDNFGVSPATHEAKEEKLRLQLEAENSAQQNGGAGQNGNNNVGVMGPPALPTPTSMPSAPAPTPAATPAPTAGGASAGANTLEEFLAAFASDNAAAAPQQSVSGLPSPALPQLGFGLDNNTNRGPLSLPLPYNLLNEQQHHQHQQHQPTTLDSALLSIANLPPFDFSSLSGVGFDASALTAAVAAPTPTVEQTQAQAQAQAQAQKQAAEAKAEAERVSGAKRLKSLGAGPAEIEEDKRRRNTEASARFRAKKKERESALEIRAKELEIQIAQLTADNTSLLNENKLLKAIVLGSGQGEQLQLQGALASASAVLSQSPSTLAEIGTGSKRKRSE